MLSVKLWLIVLCFLWVAWLSRMQAGAGCSEVTFEAMDGGRNVGGNGEGGRVWGHHEDVGSEDVDMGCEDGDVRSEEAYLESEDGKDVGNDNDVECKRSSMRMTRENEEYGEVERWLTEEEEKQGFVAWLRRLFGKKDKGDSQKGKSSREKERSEKKRRYYMRLLMKKRWPHKTLPIKFHPMFSKELRKHVHQVMEWIHKKTCVRMIIIS